MACHLYPEGPSVSARHVPEHFVDNVIPASDVGSERRFYSGRNKSPSMTSSVGTQGTRRMSGAMVYDGTKATPVFECFNAKEPSQRRRAGSIGSRSDWGASWGGWEQPTPITQNLGPFQGLTATTKPPPAKDFDFQQSPGKGRALQSQSYKSHAHMQHDKRNCQAAAIAHNDNWEHIGAGDAGPPKPQSYVASFGAVTPRNGPPSSPAKDRTGGSIADSQTSGRAGCRPMAVKTRNASADATRRSDSQQRRARSTDGMRSSRRPQSRERGPQTPRPASAERFSSRRPDSSRGGPQKESRRAPSEGRRRSA